MEHKNKGKGKGISPTRSAPSSAPTRSAQQKKTSADVVVALPSRVEELCGNKNKQTSSRTAPTRTNPTRAANKKKIIECSDDNAVIKQDEIVEGVFSRTGLTRAALNKKKKPLSGWSDGESEASHTDTIPPMEQPCAPTSDDTRAATRTREELHAMLDNILDRGSKRDASAASPTRANTYASSHDASSGDVRQMRYASLNAMLDNFLDGDNKRDAFAASPTRTTRATTAYASSHDGRSGDVGQISYNPLHVKNVLLEALIDKFFSKHDVAAPTRATTGCAVPVKERKRRDDSDEETTPKIMAAAPTRNYRRSDGVAHDDSVEIVHSAINVKKPVVNRKVAANCAAAATPSYEHLRAARMKELLDTSDEEDVKLTSSKMSGTPTGHVGRRGLSLSTHMMMQAAHTPQISRRGAAIRDDSESPTMAAAPTRKNAKRVGAPTATTRRVAHRETFDFSPTRYASSSEESVDSETTHFVSMLVAKDIIVDTDDENEFARMFANRAAVTFGESP